MTSSEVRDFPKVDLHRHLLGSARPETLWELARKYGLDVGRQPLDAFRATITHRQAVQSLAEYIRPWSVFREVIREPEDIRRIAYEAAVDACLDGILYVEFRSSLTGMPVTDGNAPQTRIRPDEYLCAIGDGFADATGVVCRLVASVNRHAFGKDPANNLGKYTDRFLEVATRFRNDLVVGVDLTGIEHGWPARAFTPFFTEARRAGFPITIHAGETEGPEEVWAAIDDLGASRVGHGTSASRDPTLIEELNRRNIVLEVCPTATRLVGISQTDEGHPIINGGGSIPFVICSDNPTLNDSALSDELLLAAGVAGVRYIDFLTSQYRLATQAAFSSAALAPSTPPNP